MKITAISSGGFAGLGERVELDTSCHADGQAIESLLDQLDFFDARPQPAVGADLVRWDISADDGRRCHSVVLHEDALPAEWQALLAHLRAHAHGGGA